VKPEGVGLTSLIPDDLPDTVFSGFLIRFRDTGLLDRAFKEHCFWNVGFRRRLVSNSTVSANTNINQDALKRLLLAFPPSLHEQRAIATALSDVDALLGALERLIAKKRDLKQAAMQQLITGQTRLPGFHDKWEVVEFGDIATIRNTKVLASAAPVGTQCVELESIGQGSGRLLMSTDASGLSSKYSFKKGDVLFGRLRAYLRKYWYATFDGVCSTEIWPLIARDERLYGGFLYLLVQTNDFVNAAGVSYGTRMPRSDWSVLKTFAVRLPPAPEQTAISAILSDMDAELSALVARRDKTRDLKQAMMQKLLTGKTRLVPTGGAHA
jgi:type I restriction enzyme S subunit